ncbi:hypothetical protein BDW59DRAFT_95073 [Aspergillus cavernicola]|uniref:Uncharacterized protein n=1 Tax=Aspergillus cavernicola TaxID=176166 RepID=A0ABR4IZ08_9EURO
MATSTDLEAQQPLLEADEYDSYSWVLLEDHPLRSYPTDVDCHPDISAFTRKCYVVARRRWRERVLPLLCLLLMFFVIVQFLLQLPHFASHLLEPISTEEVPGFIQSAQMERATQNAVEYALASGCTGVRADLWLRNGDLLLGTELNRTLQSVYLRPLLARLEAQNAASNESANGRVELDQSSSVGLFDEDTLQSFTLFLDIRTPMRMAWPQLIAQLEELNERGYLSYRNVAQDIVSRPVTVVVSGGGNRRLSLVDDLSRIMKGLF